MTSKHVQVDSPFYHSLRTDSGTKSSQSNFSAHNDCRSIFAFTMTGENQPKASNVLAISDISARFVTLSSAGGQQRRVEIYRELNPIRFPKPSYS